MQQYNVFQAIFLSFYSKKLYRDIAMNWGGKSFAYLLMLLAFTSIYFVYSTQQMITRGYHDLYVKVGPQVPTFSIDEGKVVTPEKRPYVISDPDTHANLAVIDTTGRYKTIDEAKSVVLVTETEVITHPKPNETKIYQIPTSVTQAFDPQKINYFIERVIGFLWMVILFFALLLHYLYRILQALLYSLVGKIFSLIVGVPLSYWQIVQIMMVAITPVIILSTLQHSFHIYINHETLLYFSLGMLYLFYGILANKGYKESHDGA